MDDDRVRALLGIKRKLVGQADAYPPGIEKVEELRLVLEIGTCRVAEAVPGT